MMALSRCPHVCLTTLLFLLCLFLYVDGQNHTHTTGQNHTHPDIRLVDFDGTTGGSMGRVEVLFGGRWGTVCDDGWDINEAKVVCRMLGFSGAICAVQYAHFGQGAYGSPIWMDNLRCTGYETELRRCPFHGWGHHDCGHYEDAGVVCVDGEEFDSEVGSPPTDISLAEATTTSITLNWTAPAVPIGSSPRYTIEYRKDTDRWSNTQTCYTSSMEGEEVTCSLNHLERATNYSVKIRMEYRYFECGYLYANGNYSETLYFQTNATRRVSSIPMRLVPPTGATEFDFLGRVEVFHDNEWGTICDTNFYSSAAEIACQMLNFTEGVRCTVYNSNLGRGQGRIWLDDISCDSGDEILEDCNIDEWGTNECTHYDDVGVICEPNRPPLPPVQNFTVINASANSITVGWDPYQFPSASIVSRRGFTVFYNRTGRRYSYPQSRSIYVSRSLTDYTAFTLNYLNIGDEYNISVKPYIRFSGCYYNNIYGEGSEVLSAETVEIAPLSPPEDFHLVALNTTSIEVQFDLPPYNRRGGIIRGYRIFVQPADGGEETMIEVPDNRTEEYIVTGLERDSPYRFSVLAYTSVGNGPRTLILTINTLDYDPLITQFGYWGNGLDRYTVSSWSSRANILCGTYNHTHVQLDWYFPNGSRVGVVDRGFRAGHLPNGTAVLQIEGQVNFCWGGNYTCIADSDTESDVRVFTLLVNYSPPRPETPFVVDVHSSSVTIGWEYPACDGGHTLRSFTLSYSYRSGGYYYYRNRYINNIGPNIRQYTVDYLQPETDYGFQVKAIDTHGRESSYSSRITVSTLPPAPSPPRDVTVRQVGPLMVEVRWRSPAVSSGNVSHYTVYAIPVLPSGNESDFQIRRVFPSDVTAGNMTLKNHSILYHFRVRAGMIYDESYNEGELSLLNSNTILFIDKPDVKTTTSPAVSNQTTPKPSVSPSQVSVQRTGATAGEIGGITIGVIIIILLIALLVVLLIKKHNYRNISVFKRMGHKENATEEHTHDEIPFGTESKSNSMYDLDDTKKLATEL